MEVGLYCYLNADILTKVLQKCSLSSPLPNISFLFNPLNLIVEMATERLNLAKIFRNRLLRSHEGEEAKTLQNSS